MSHPTHVTAPITARARDFAAFVDSLDVENKWLPGVAVDWLTGEPTSLFTVLPTDTHCSAFAAVVAKRVGIYLLQPPDHNPSLLNQLGEEYLANAQSFWLNALYDPAAPSDPSVADEQIDPNVITAAQAGWANVATLLAADSSAYQLELQAQDLANAGYLVVASILGNQNYTPGGPPPPGPGHIVVLMPANLSEADLTNRGPAEAQSGEVNSSFTHIETGFAGHIPPPPASPLNSIAATTNYESPKIQFFYNSKTPDIPAAIDSSPATTTSPC
jgi:hypothetical protein